MMAMKVNMNIPMVINELKGMVHTIESFWSYVTIYENGSGGFGGESAQSPHCTTTYAAVIASCVITGCDERSYQEDKDLAIDLLRQK